MKVLEIDHYPVLWREVLANLPNSLETVLDCTFGHGGHAQKILQARSECRYFGLDRDFSLLEFHKKIGLDSRICLLHACFDEKEKIQTHLKIRPDLILMDLGTSQYQLQEAKRGFSFLREGPLDMRMDESQGLSLSTWLSFASEKEIAKVIREYGEEKWYQKISRAIVVNREKITTTIELASVIEQAIPFRERINSRIHPATKSFQAFRIHLNQELEVLENAMDFLIDFLRPGGRMMVIAFHSLEDRIPKQKFQDWEFQEGYPADLMAKMGLRTRIGFRVSKKAFFPSDQEIQENSASRSARLRVFEKERELSFEEK